MMVAVEERGDYELYVKNSIAKLDLSERKSTSFFKIAMRCFDDGNKLSQKNLKVEV